MSNTLLETLRKGLAGLSAAAALSAATLVGWAPADAHAAQPAAERDQAKSSGERFLRFRSVPGGGLLETSIVTYENADGVKVDLIGAVHVGDEAYYDLLNERFATYDVLLYEMVKPRDADVANRNRAAEDPPMAMQLIGGLQKAMQLALELDFQVEAIDYAAPNFVHADLDMETFLQMQADRGEGFLQMLIDQMLKDMTRPKDPNYQPVTMFEIMEAMNAPDRARRLKLLFARELSRMDDLSSVFDSDGEGSVILDERNRKAISVLDEQIEAGVDNIGIFYGAAHLKGMEEMLRERGFEQVGEPDYLVAWDMTIDGSGERAMRQRVRNTIVRNAVGDAIGDEAAQEAGAGNRGDAAAALLEGMKSELEALRRENEALRRQLEALRRQNDALRERAEQEE